MPVSYYRLRQLRPIRHSLYPFATSTLVHALICTRFDFGNSIFAGLFSLNILKLQSILNAAAHLIGGLRMFSYIYAFIQETLHWLPVTKRIQFKILTLNRNSMVGSALFCVHDVHPNLFTRWLIYPLLGYQRPSGSPPHAQCYCSIQKLRFCEPL